MKKHDCGILLKLFALSIFFVGCASMNAKNDDLKAGILESEGQKEKVEQISNVKLSEFIIGVGDTIEITVYRHDDLRRTAKIDSSGKIMFPLIGDVVVAGKGIFELRDDLQLRLSKYLIDPQVIINVTSVQSQKIIVIGEVNQPGIFNLDSAFSVSEAISKAGGVTKDAKISNIVLISRGREKVNVSLFDLEKLLKEGDFSQDRKMQNGDIVYVPATTIANVSKFFSYLSQVISPVVNLESGIVLWPQVKDVLQGKKTSTPLTIPAY